MQITESSLSLKHVDMATQGAIGSVLILISTRTQTINEIRAFIMFLVS